MSLINGYWRPRSLPFVYQGGTTNPGTPHRPSVRRKTFHQHYEGCRLCKAKKSSVHIIMTESHSDNPANFFEITPNTSDTSLNSSELSLDFIDLSETEVDLDFDDI
eukprot:Awhi_evm1s14751